ncbi:drug resistance transporter EmrB/QacA subfamily [Rhizodiscina lignyota]|uniref:Drug resistance transporter EmrB/QacA subfamily n=1 Tax=Rhizodiscina lignyota TaxID=1504668 RepID=A0A9P4M4S0_9PEZI|nr:drug resistance transporter EmrB/QacA subfamily [Rhizodiscina lignyota]
MRKAALFSFRSKRHEGGAAETSSTLDTLSSPTAQNDTTGESEEDTSSHVKGWRLHVLTAGLWVALFLSTLETTIVSTSLISITDAINGFRLRDWIVTAYLLTYTGFLVVYAKFGDIFGRKSMLILALLIFILFSILCGASNHITELILFRAFQGVGASGVYTMIIVLAPTLVPKAEFGNYIAIVSTVFVVASVLGPILGGVINHHSSWRWIFLLNAPGGAVAIVILLFFLPSSTPSLNFKLRSHLRRKFSKAALARIDVLGMFLLLASSILLVFALEEAGSRYAWKSAPIITSLLLAGILGVGFVCWELVLQRSSFKQEPVFPPRLLKGRLVAAMMLTAFFIGFPFVAIVVNIPQRAQAVNGRSPFGGGLVLLPLLLASPLATALSGILTSKFKVPPFYLIFCGSILQLVGVGLTCSLPIDTTSRIAPQQYGYQVIMGLGFGLGLSTILVIAPLLVEGSDLAVTMGAVTQIRVLGGTISLAICSTILNNHLKGKLAHLITPAQIQAISENLSSIQSLSPTERAAVRTAFAEGYNRQNIFLTVFSGLSLIASLFLWERKPRAVT